MLFHGADNGFAVSIGVAITAEMTTGIVGSDVPSDVAGAFFPVVWIGRKA